jgi:hypothetical protein
MPSQAAIDAMLEAARQAAVAEAEEAAVISGEVAAVPTALTAPETCGISIPVALAIVAAIAAVAGAIGYAVYRHEHPVQVPWSGEEENIWAQLQQLDATIASAPGVDYSVKPPEVANDPDKSAKWDECVRLHKEYEPTKELYGDKGKTLNELRAKLQSGTATLEDFKLWCQLLRERIALAKKLAEQRLAYVANDCDDLPWPAKPGTTRKTPEERRAGHTDQFAQNVESAQKLMQELVDTGCGPT